MTIATVLSISGQAWARDASGNLRELRVGDTLQEGETVVTSNGGDVQLDFGDNLDPTQIEGGEQVLITQELSTDQPVEASEFAALDEDLEALLAALEDDTVDLLDILDATAAGAGPGGAADGGHSFVRLVRIVEDTNPLAFDYGLNALGGPPDEQGGAFALAEVEEEIEPPEPVVIPPSAGSFEASLFDVDTLSSSGSVASGILPVSFGSGSGGSVSFAAMDGVTLQVGGETLTFSWNAATNTLQAISETRGITIFTVELNPTTGAFTVTQVNNLLHGEGMDSALVGLVYTVTSSSGSVTGTLQLTIVDDVPAVSVGTIDLGGLELITFDNETLDGNTSIAGGSVAVTFMAAVNVSYGADGEGSLVIDGYTLSLGNVAHGLTSGGVPIVFSLVNGTVIGSAGGNEVLRIEIDATTGDVTVTQSGPVDHAAQGADSLTLPVGLISVSATVTVTDGDGDTVSDSLTADLGGSITIVDDVPAVSVGTIDLGDLELITFDNETLDGNTSIAGGSVAVAFLAAVNVSYGADGEGSLVIDGYTLSLGNVAHGLTSGGVPIVFSLVNGTVIGSAGGNEVLRIEIDATTGDVTVTQSGPVDHAAQGADSLTLPVGLISVSATVTVTDGDGDTASDSLTADLGGSITIVDDVPAVSVGTIDLGDLGFVIDDTDTRDGGTSTATGSVATLFLGAVTATYGADGPGDTEVSDYALVLNGGIDHGLKSGGTALVFTQLAGGDIIATAGVGGAEVLRFSIDDGGQLTITQSAAIDHAPGTDSLTLPAGLISVTATVTVTDSDHDEASTTASADLSGAVTVLDDVPAVSVGTIDLGSLGLVIDDTDIRDGGTSTATGSVAALFLGAVTATYGADGPGDTEVSDYALVLNGGIDHGLKSGGTALVFTQLAGGDIIATAGVGGAEVLRFSIDDGGQLTITQSAAIDHAPGTDSLTLPAGLISVTATVTVTDSDHDEASTTASVDLSGAVTVLDDVPAVSVGTIDLGSLGFVIDDTDTRDGGTSTATGSVAALFLGAVTATYGADGPGDTEVSDYALVLNGGIDHGLKSGGTALVFTQLAGGDIIATAGVGGAEVLRFSIDDGGQLTITQSAAIDHAPGTDSLTLPAGLISVTATVTVTDSDHDEASTTASVDLSGAVTVLDDAPSLTSLNLAIANVAGIYEGIYEFEVGGDVQGFLGSFGEGSLIWTGMPDGYVLTITDSGETWVTYTAKSGSFEFFDLTLNADGTYAFDLLSPAPVVETTIESLLSAFNKDNFFKEGGKDAYLFTADVFDGKFALAVTAYRNGKLEDVSMSSTDLGVKSNVVQGQHNEALRFDVRPVEGQGAIGVSTITFSVSGTAGSSAGDKATLTVYDVNGSMTVYTAELLAGNGEFVFNIDPTHNVDYMELRPAGNNSFKIDGVFTSYVTQIYPDDYQLDFVLTGSDADGDTATADFSVFVKTTETGSYEITGSDGDDVVHGTAGNDVLIGDAGNDTLIGGEGDDVFQWNLGDQGDNDAPAIDTVVDFGLGNNVLDLADLLQGESLGTIGDFIFAAQEGASTVLYINHEGNIGVDGTNATQVIVLENFTTGEVGSAEILAELLANSQLNVDP
ncbi:retention module-containing protein [Halomonas daqingensis]|uniref:Retention module-containing protein n=1 Tax=Billgrantia desiderata TaxID=52021 RepID=A0AAW4Z1I8_9GAMM|nr:retention module-containing protein [Halomonas desiderata]MCE8053792.1 retention module-containing protein [Halomonas desiderata]